MIEVAIIYQADPLGAIAGGIDSFIRGILRWAPEDINFSLVGVTTDINARAVGKWTVCAVGGKPYRFFPVAPYTDPSNRGRLPLVVRFVQGLLRYRPVRSADVLEFHRIEPSMAFFLDRRPKTVVIHQNMQDLYNKKSDIRWNKVPGLYFWLQDKLIPKFSSVYVVREDAVSWYKERYPGISGRFRFTPTWYDPEVFKPAAVDRKSAVRCRLNIKNDEELIVTVGRLDSQKDPLLLAKSMALVLERRPRARLVYVGDGILRGELERLVQSEGLEDKVSITGILAPEDVAEVVASSDVFALSSAYEGMPICVLEALGCGVPVVSTNVGEVCRVVKTGVNGYVVERREPEVLANGIISVLNDNEKYAGKPCVDAVADYRPQHVLAALYDNYRKLAGQTI